MQKNECHADFTVLLNVLNQPASAAAIIKGDGKHGNISGKVLFYQTPRGVLVAAEVCGLPGEQDKCKSPVFAFHIHASAPCSGNAQDPFDVVGSHYNPENCPHPHHAGDLPPLFGNNGYAFLMTLTDRFAVNDIIGKTVIIHSSFDDFTTQPSGNAGTKIACGEIKKAV